MLKSKASDKDQDQDMPGYPNLEFHLRKALDESYGLDLPMFALENGKFKIDFHQLQHLIFTLGQLEPAKDLKASELHGMGLLNLLSHKLIRLYRNQVNPEYIHDLTNFLEESLSPKVLNEVLENYLTMLPSDAFKASEKTAADYLKSQSQSVANIHIVVEELLVHILAINNPAFEKYGLVFKEVFHKTIESSDELLKAVENWSAEQRGFGAEKANIIDLLLAPMRAAPGSIEEQLAFVRSKWSHFLGSHLMDLLRGMDHFEEENRFRGFGPGETQVPSYSGELDQGEYYSADSDWMPRVVMIARNSLVWLDQLSKKYKRDIKTLNDIPDQELDLLAQQGFTVLWLIGLWNRSDISKKIKHWCGNPDAESSAYSLKEYQIDPSIGGPDALADLKHRAWERGIRLASDMVPNHTGLDSQWLKDHPDWYISSPQSPFPSYRFDGGDLSSDPEISIHLEDHYYDRSDAAVVYKMHDHRNGNTRYIYHGNDGTSMPWNDTAQLNYLNPELREAIIQTILDVARQFKVIRFDAAMTLAKRHVQRLWFPQPGSGGDIPSRSAFSMSGVDFDAAIPTEFWREVVERVSREVPDTLLLAEAFWMMESYFVRTLGMHRVYNSAFMNMLKMEENDKFFEMIAKTLEFDPRILQRFVNFLSNPDEDTAIAQFGKGDKYFGATVLMVTLPGLPMFAHAQIEGFEEKYGMEYRRAYWDESPDEALIERHKRQIFPLMKKRYLYAGASNFRLFPFMNSDGYRVDSVFAYSNHSGTERSLILVNNAYASQTGWVKTAVPFNSDPMGDHPKLLTEDLIQGLSFDVENSYYIIFQEQGSNLWFIRTVAEIRERGLYFELSGYEAQIYMGFQLVSDTESNPWWNIHQDLAGAGIADFAPMFKKIELEPVHSLFTRLIHFVSQNDTFPEPQSLFMKFAPLFEAILELENITLDYDEIEAFNANYDTSLRQLLERRQKQGTQLNEEIIQMAGIIFLTRQIAVAHPDLSGRVVRNNELEIPIKSISATFLDESHSALPAVLELADQSLAMLGRDTFGYFSMLFKQAVVQDYFMVNQTEKIKWFKKERMETFLYFFEALFFEALSESKLASIHKAVHDSKYQLDRFLEKLSP